MKSPEPMTFPRWSNADGSQCYASTFRRAVMHAYDGRCAVTGWKLVNGGGRLEAQAAHIRPVEHGGPDSVRNGLALSGTAHWMFDRGLIGFRDDLEIIVHRKVNDREGVEAIINPTGKPKAPEIESYRPHPKSCRGIVSFTASTGSGSARPVRAFQDSVFCLVPAGASHPARLPPRRSSGARSRLPRLRLGAIAYYHASDCSSVHSLYSGCSDCALALGSASRASAGRARRTARRAENAT